MTSFSISSSSSFPLVTIDICLIKPVECKRKFDLDCRKWLDDPLLLINLFLKNSIGVFHKDNIQLWNFLGLVIVLFVSQGSEIV